MTTLTALEKRIKRRVIAARHSLFAATAPGLAPLCREELADLLPEAAASTTRGGVQFEGRLETVWQANLMVRTANRIVMRIASFRAANFDRLREELTKIPWELYLYADTALKVRTATHKSRLYHGGAVSRQVTEAVAARRQATTFARRPENEPPPTQMVLVRAVRDRFTLSLDTSGELLHKRGWKQDVGRAPIRETLAAAILRQADYRGQVCLLDPMSGAGTLAIEAALLAHRIPPGWRRSFVFMHWPSFRPRRWAYLKGTFEKAMHPAPAATIVAADQDPAALARLEANLERAGLPGAVSTVSRSFFDLDPANVCAGPGLAVINPPYGRRIEAAGGVAALFEAIARRLKTHYAGWQVALIAPPGASPPADLQRLPLYHGGLRLNVFVGRMAK